MQRRAKLNQTWHIAILNRAGHEKRIPLIAQRRETETASVDDGAGEGIVHHRRGDGGNNPALLSAGNNDLSRPFSPFRLQAGEDSHGIVHPMQHE
jgi:hypothetical protein